MADTITTIGKLLAHAERAATEAEAEAFFAKAQALASRDAIDLAVAAQRHERAHRTQAPTTRQVTVVPDGLSAYYRSAYARLFTVIAVVNDLEVDIARNSSYVVLFGFPTDIDVVERLYASVLIQMVAAADHRIRDKAHHRVEVEDPWGDLDVGRVDARRYRNGFYRGYADTISERLTRARDKAIADAERVHDVVGRTGHNQDRSPGDGRHTVAVVLADKRAQVRAHHSHTSRARGTWRGGRSQGNRTAARHGSRAARDAVLTSRRGLRGPKGQLTGGGGSA